ncbi:hypothetical protein SESBI_45236 [Sesbania bispinosa]|nr:hypothetical protein SESBI_45236 [Sesbania bispinosa]
MEQYIVKKLMLANYELESEMDNFEDTGVDSTSSPLVTKTEEMMQGKRFMV